MAHRQREDYATAKRRRLRARRAMFALAATCSLAAIGIGGFELASDGWNAFLDRPAGVGATPPRQASAEPVVARPTADASASSRSPAPLSVR